MELLDLVILWEISFQMLPMTAVYQLNIRGIVELK